MTKTLRNGKKYTSNAGSPEEIYVLSSSTMESTQHDGLGQEPNEESFVDDSEFERLSKLLRLPGDDDLWMPDDADAGAAAPMPANFADEASNVPANNFPFPDLAPPKYDGRATPVTDKVQYPLMPAAWPGAATAEDSAVHAEIRNALNTDISNYKIPQLGVYPLEESYGSLLDHDPQPREQDSMEVSEPDKGKDDYPLNEIEDLPDEPPSSPSDSSSSSSSDPSSDDSSTTEDTDEDTVLVAKDQGDKANKRTYKRRLLNIQSRLRMMEKLT
ncbi:hypothetical protein M407DRAFT_28693 [Tulasnella calospora MUT 4182]|uniref:Uncharacterized protein n=1 Tax=Tulasnella calospora MUT 4182 TaxID=1051891 RepID=A0A0C3Q110_9AGAM|nr:hypothetical protein M407DRAFT_28693 [Tulasnella calospora MUT 4182]